MPILRHFNLRNLLAIGGGEYTVLALLLIAVSVSILAHQIGFHPAIGAYMAGLIIRREYFDFHRSRGIDFHKRSREIIDNIAFVWIGPVFFVTLGSKLVFEQHIFLAVIPQTLFLFATLPLLCVLSRNIRVRPNIA